LSGFFNETGLKSVLDEDSLEPCTGDDGAVLCAPISAQFWWVIHSPSAFAAIDMSPPSTFRDLIESCKRFRIAGIVPIFLPAKDYDPLIAFWDILNIRTNGGTFHRKLSSGTVPFTDPRVIRTFENWQDMIDARCFQDDLLESALYDKKLRQLWRDKRVAMVFMGDFYRSSIVSWGVDEADIDVMPFPTVNESVVTAELMPFDAIIVRRTTEQIRPVFELLSLMLSQKTFNILTYHNMWTVSSRKDTLLPWNSAREQGEKMLRSTDRRRNPDRRLANFNLIVPPEFSD
jgi:multiple sugar transport system substrate-binding protein